MVKEIELRSTMAHEMVHLLQFQQNIGIGDQKKKYEYQATFLSWGRGYAMDFVKAFPASCKEEICHKNQRHCYFRCGQIFARPCRECTEKELAAIARRLERLSAGHTLSDFPDFMVIVRKEFSTTAQPRPGAALRESGAVACVLSATLI